jgi:integrative and conjugative element protein (TIGR02256 family)
MGPKGRLFMPFLSDNNRLNVSKPALVVHFSAPVLAEFFKYRQTNRWSSESGGQLFARIQQNQWTIVTASGPKRTDIRRRFRFFPDRNAEQLEINSLFDQGLHYVGDWHTHPEHHPAPSTLDLESMRDLTKKSRHQLPGFLMVIVGTADAPSGLWVSLHLLGGELAEISTDP